MRGTSSWPAGSAPSPTTRPFQIAVGCRLHGEARAALHTGALGDPTLCTRKDAMDAATGTAVWGAGVGRCPRVHATTRLARDAMECWSPERHWLFHGRCPRGRPHRAACAGAAEQDASRTRAQALMVAWSPVYLPAELWFYVCSMLLRRDWAA